MTTSFAWFARGNLVASAYVQPMGMIGALLCCATMLTALYIAVTGRAAHRLLLLVPTASWLYALFACAIAGWGWKIFIVLRGIDGWR